MNENPERDGATPNSVPPSTAAGPVLSEAKAAASPAAPSSSSAPDIRAGTAPAPERNPAKALSLLGIALLAAGFVWLAVRQDELQQRLAAMSVPASGPDAGTLAALETRLAALERRPTPTADLRPVEARVAALEARPAGSGDVAALASRLAALEQRQAPTMDSSALTNRIVALEQRPAPVPQPDPRVDALAARLDKLVTTSAQLVAEESALRLQFPEAARQAAAASKVQAGDRPVLERMWSEVSSLVTVKDGERVLSGPPAEPRLEAARRFLAAGDFPSAIKALDGLDAGAAQAMAAWRSRAEKLVAARSALAKVGG